MGVGKGFGAIVGGTSDGRRRLPWLACVLACLLASLPASGHGHGQDLDRDQDLDDWIQTLGEAAIESPAPPASDEAQAATAATTRGCAAMSVPGDLVLRAGGPCGIERLAQVLRQTARAMNASSDPVDCGHSDVCRRRLRAERLRRLAAMNHESSQLVRGPSRGAPYNVALPPARGGYAPNWAWRPYH